MHNYSSFSRVGMPLANYTVAHFIGVGRLRGHNNYAPKHAVLTHCVPGTGNCANKGEEGFQRGHFLWMSFMNDPKSLPIICQYTAQ